MIYKDKRGKYRWRLKVINEIIAVSVKGYKSEIDCGRSIDSVCDYLIRRFSFDNIEKFAFDTELDGLKCIAINKILPSLSEYDSFMKKCDVMILFVWQKNHWKVSLYSNKVDVSRIAINREGGGSKTMASFKCKTLPFKLC